MRLANQDAANLSYLVIACYALTGRQQVIQALALSWLFTMINPGLAPDASYAALLRYVVLSAGALSISFRGGIGYLKGFNLWTVFLGGFIVMHALLFSPFPVVSLLKASSWTLAMGTLLLAWSALSAIERDDLVRWLFGFLVLVLLASLPLLAVPAIGFLRNGSGFQGILNHPQVIGPTMTLLCSFSVSSLLQKRNPSVWLVVISICSFILILLSEARTAGLSLIIGLPASVLLLSLIRQNPIGKVAPFLVNKRGSLFFLIVLVIGLFFATRVGEISSQFLSKSGRADVSGLFDAYQRSRSILYLAMLDNINQNPIEGIGFGVASVPGQMNIQTDPYFNLPIGASVEKGVLPVAITEELGIPGLLLVGAWAYILVKRSSSNGLSALSVSIVALILNLGEAVLFSPGGMGMLTLIFLSYSASGSSAGSQIISGNNSLTTY
jgi:hypothetical protein